MSLFTPYIFIFHLICIGLPSYGSYLQKQINEKPTTNGTIDDTPNALSLLVGILVVYALVVGVFSALNIEIGQLLEQNGVYKLKKGNDIRILSKEEYDSKMMAFIRLFSAAWIVVGVITVSMFHKINRLTK